MNTPVSFELAKLLKEKGFIETCEKVYRSDGLLYIPMMSGSKLMHSNILEDESVSAPTIAEVCMWLYETHGIWISVLQMLNNGEKVTWYASYYEKGVGEDIDVYYNSPTKAYEAAIEYTLQNLI